MSYLTTGERLLGGEPGDRDRTVLIGPDTVLMGARPRAGRAAADAGLSHRAESEWVLELYERAGNTVRVLIAGGEE